MRSTTVDAGWTRPAVASARSKFVVRKSKCIEDPANRILTGQILKAVSDSEKPTGK
jgi:hypothetical protein